jgi:hypothetical protein
MLRTSVWRRVASIKVIGRPVSRNSSDAGLNLCMAVRAQKGALGGLSAGAIQRSRRALAREREGLRRGIEMVELQRAASLRQRTHVSPARPRLTRVTAPWRVRMADGTRTPPARVS